MKYFTKFWTWLETLDEDTQSAAVLLILVVTIIGITVVYELVS